MTKICTKCKKELPKNKEFFHHKKQSIDGFKHCCKECCAVDAKKHRESHKESIALWLKEYYIKNKDCYKEKKIAYYQKNKENIMKNSKIYYENNKTLISEKQKEYFQLNKERMMAASNIYKKNRRKYDTTFYINSKVSRAISHVLNGKNGKTWKSMVNFTVKELIEHLEKLFLPGMSWENKTEWQIDHIRPVKTFNFTSYEDKEFKECWSLSNLQPLWKEENLLKRAKWDPKQQYKNGDIQMALTL